MKERENRCSTLVAAAPVIVALGSALALADTTYTGRVFQPDGQPAAKTDVKLYYFHDLTGYGSKWLSQARTDDLGNFRIVKPDFDPPPVLPQSPDAVGCYLVADHPQYAMAISDLIPGKTDGYDLWLDTPRRVSFEIVDKPEGNPVKDVDVALLLGIGRMFPLGRASRVWQSPLERAYQQIGRGVCSMKSGEDGTGEFVNAFYGARLVEVYADETGGYDFINWTGDAHTTIRAWANPMIYHGRATDSQTGAPLSDILVWASHDSWEMTIGCGYAITNPKGEYTIRTWPHETPNGRKMLYAVDAAAIPEHAPAKVILFEGRGLQPDVDIPMARGTLVSGTVTDKDTGKPLAGMILCAGVGQEWGDLLQRRITDSQGRYAFALEGDSGFVKVERAPLNYIVRDPGRRVNCKLRGEKIAEDFAVTIAEPRRWQVLFKDAAGKGVPAVEASVAPRDYSGGLRGTTDGAGKLDVVGLGLQPRPRPGGQNMLVDTIDLGQQPPPISVYGATRDGSLAAFAGITSEELAAGKPVDIQMKRTQTVEVAMLDANGANVAGQITVDVSGGIGGSHRVAAFEVPEAGDFVARVHYLPDVDYTVWGWVQNGMGGGSLNFKYAEADKPGRLLIRVEGMREQAGQTFTPPITRPPSEMQEPKDALWTKQDSVDKNLMWYALKNGFAYTDSQKREVKQFDEVLGETKWVINTIAFGKDKVWLGANKGLLSWDRQNRFLSRFAVGGELMEAAVTEMTLGDDGKLTVTAQEPAQPLRHFEFDIGGSKWTEAK